MAEYHFYYIGWMDKDQKIRPLGIYDCNGKLHPVISKTRSFMSDLYEDFYYVPDEMITDELRKEFTYKDYEDNEQLEKLRYLPLSQLGSGDFIKTGYFLINDVEAYHNGASTDDIFYEKLSPEAYAAKLQTEISIPHVKKSSEDDDEDDASYGWERSAADFMYFAYPDYLSREYEVHQLRDVAEMYEMFEWDHRKEGITLVALFC